MDQEDRQVWHRVVARRRQECASLDKLVALQFLSSLPDDAPEGSPSDQLEFALKSAYDIASDPNVRVKERRLAFEAIQRLRKSLNESLAQQQKLMSARTETTTATAVTTAKAPTTTLTTTATTTTNKSQDQTRLPAVPQVTPPGSVPPASTPRVSDTSASTNSSEPSRPQVSQNTAVTSTGSPPLHTTTASIGNTGPGQVTANTSRSPDPPGTTAKANTNTATASASDSQRSKDSSKSSTNTGNKDSTTQPTTSASRSQPIASINPPTTTVAGTRNLSLPIQNGTTGIDSVSKSSHNVSQPAPASRSNQSTRPSTNSTGNASSISHGNQAATATSTVPTQKSTTATGSTDKSTPNVPQTTAGATSRKSSTQNGTAASTPTISQTTTTMATWGVPTKISPTSTGVGDKPKSPHSLFQSLTTARTTSQSTQASATANATVTGNAATNNKSATTTLQTSNAGTGTATVTIARTAPAAPQTSTRAETWSKTQQTSTTATGNSGKTSSSAPQNTMGLPGWMIPTKTSTTATTTAPVTHQTATGSGNSNQPTSNATSGVSNVGRTTFSAPQNVATTTGSWVLPSQTAPTNDGSTGRNSTSVSKAPSSTIERAPQQTGIDTGATAANRHAGVSQQTNATALANKNRSITADLVAAATTTAQVAADAVSDVQPATASKTKPSQQTIAGVAPNTAAAAPPAYQQRSDAVVAIEKAKRAEKNGRSSQSAANASTSNVDSTSGVPPSIMSPFDPPMSLKKRPWHDTTNSNGMENGANKDRNKPASDSSSSQEPPQKNPRLQEQPVAAMEPTTQIAKSQIVIDFPPDTKPGGDAGSRFSYSQSDRPAVRVYFHRHWPSYEMLRGAGRLFEIWEPYWQVEKVIASGVTSPVEKLEWKAKPPARKDVGNVPRTVALFDVPSLAPTDVSKISWGMVKAQATSKPKDGDCTLLLRMLPIKRKPDENKKRANTHIWPIGTFLMINNAPVPIAQRKQASHDLSKWEYLSHPLELSYHIKNPKEQISISMCCQDATQYFYMVSVCSYKSPLTLKDRLLEPNNSFLHSLSMTESAKKAMEYINKNSMISIDDDDTGPKNDETGLLIFSLVDPVTKVLMKTPVRGQKCKHWQCFDLQSFMEVNAPVSGGRWRCVCCEQFVNYQDLEVCGLTKEALVRFADVASATRDRVEFRADQTMTLLPAPKARYNNKRRQPPGNSASSSSKPPVKNQQSVPDPIEIIDLD